MAGSDRIRRWALQAAPFAGAAIVFAVVLLAVNQPWSHKSHVAASGKAPHATTSTSEDAAGASTSTTATDGTGGPTSSVARGTTAGGGGGGTGTTAPPQTTTTVSPWAGCVPLGTQAPQPRDRCWQTFTAPQGNYTGAGPSARGCVVHNTGTYSQSHDDLHCAYDATNPGGYLSDGPFNMIRIVRNGRTITIDGTAAPLCGTNIIQPGDAVYVDGRNDFDSNGYPSSTQSNGTTTTKVGDDFQCATPPSS